VRAFEPFFMPFSPVSRWKNQPAIRDCTRRFTDAFQLPQTHTFSQLELRHWRNRPTTQTGRRGSVQLSVSSTPARTGLSSFSRQPNFLNTWYWPCRFRFTKWQQICSLEHCTS
jgi:hypothetical protein